MYVGLAKLTMWLDGSEELRYKKSTLQSIKSRAKRKFNISIAQVDEDPDSGNFMTIGISIVGNSTKIIDQELKKTINFIESLSLGRVHEEKFNISYYDG